MNTDPLRDPHTDDEPWPPTRLEPDHTRTRIVAVLAILAAVLLLLIGGHRT